MTTYDYDSDGHEGLPPLEQARTNLTAFLNAWGDGEVEDTIDGPTTLHTRDIWALLAALPAPDAWEYGVRHAQGTNPCRDEAEARRRYAELVTYDHRRQSATRGRNAIVRRVPAGAWHTIEAQQKDQP